MAHTSEEAGSETKLINRNGYRENTEKEGAGRIFGGEEERNEKCISPRENWKHRSNRKTESKGERIKAKRKEVWEKVEEEEEEEETEVKRSCGGDGKRKKRKHDNNKKRIKSEKGKFFRRSFAAAWSAKGKTRPRGFIVWNRYKKRQSVYQGIEKNLSVFGKEKERIKWEREKKEWQTARNLNCVYVPPRPSPSQFAFFVVCSRSNQKTRCLRYFLVQSCKKKFYINKN